VAVTVRAARAPGFVFMLVVLLLGQALGTMATSILPAVAPAVARTHGIAASSIGYQVSIVAVFMLASLLFGANLAVRWGATRVCQIGAVITALGALMAALPHPAFVFLSAVPLGAGYALISPAASQLMIRYTPASHRNFLFSLKQSGVPMGGVAAALVAPALAVTVGWQWSLAINALTLLLLALAMERARAHWDTDRVADAPWLASPLGGLTLVWRTPALRWLGLAGCAFVVMQVALSTYTVLLFVEDFGWGLVQAGWVLTASQIGGVAGRMFWGWLADAMRNCLLALAWLAAVMLVSSLLCLALGAATPLALCFVLFFVLGSTGSGWNGAFLAEVARLAPAAEVSSATGGSLFLVNLGRLAGPLIFAAALALGGNYAWGFALMAAPAALGLLCLAAARGPR
jgi:MFS family permease